MSVAQTLVLSSAWEPVNRISWQRAMTLLGKGKVKIIEEYEDETIHSASMTINVPAVVQILRHVSRKKAVKFSRSNIYMRDGHKCQYCGRKQSPRVLTYDHVVPRVQGGQTRWDNIATCCQACNTKKGARTPEQAGMKLLKIPVRPGHLPSEFVMTVSRTASIPDIWRSYVYWTTELDHTDEDPTP